MEFIRGVVSRENLLFHHVLPGKNTKQSLLRSICPALQNQPPPCREKRLCKYLLRFTEEQQFTKKKFSVFQQMSVCGNGRRPLEDKHTVVIYCRLFILLIKTHIKKIYVREIFKLCGGKCPSTALLIYSQRANGPLEICLFYGNCLRTWDKLTPTPVLYSLRCCRVCLPHDVTFLLFGHLTSFNCARVQRCGFPSVLRAGRSHRVILSRVC